MNAFDEELVVGRRAVAEYMAFGMADNYLEITGWKPIYLHNDRVQIRWRDCCPDGTIRDHSIAKVASEACG